MDDFRIYPSGLLLTGRRVVVVGGGHVAQRRVPQLIAVGADVHVVSPEVTPAIEGMVGSGEVTWHERGFVAEDLDETWYVIAATATTTSTRRSPRPPRYAGSSASAPTTRPARPRGRPRSAGTPA